MIYHTRDAPAVRLTELETQAGIHERRSEELMQLATAFARRLSREESEKAAVLRREVVELERRLQDGMRPRFRRVG